VHSWTSILALLAVAAAQEPATTIEGRWVNPARSVIIDIAPCGTALCGTVAWANAQARQDAGKGAPALVGTQLLTGLQPSGDRWKGKLFVPDRKVRVTARLRLIGGRQLKVSGCAMGGLVCDSQVWSRTDEPLPLSD
jgi:uncharacterized protein (DUF2147 family)